MTVLTVAAAVVTTTGAARPPPIRPSIPHDSPDPTVLALGHRYDAYSTNSRYGTKDFHVPVRSSTRLTRGWSKARDALPEPPVWVDQ